MPVRLYVAPIDVVDGGLVSRAASLAAGETGNRTRSVILADKLRGGANNVYGWCATLADVPLARHAVIEADPLIVEIPRSRLDDAPADLTAAQRQRLLARLEAMGIAWVWTMQTPLRVIWRDLLTAQEPMVDPAGYED